MEGGESQAQERAACDSSILLELAAADDLIGFKTAVEVEGLDVDGFGLWYGRKLGSRIMGLEERTPLMVASLFGSQQVLSYILESGCVDINRACGSDGATALHCAVAGGSAAMLDVVKLLLDAGADDNCVDVKGNKPSDLSFSFKSERRILELMLKGRSDFDELHVSNDVEGKHDEEVSSPIASKDGTERKEYPNDLSLPDIKEGLYGTDEFRMYTFKIKPCSRAYSHDWTECPFVHPGENARRRDPRKYHYSCVPCPEFRKGTCRQGDVCEYAHGIFECWLHPAQYRTRLCKDETGCNRKVCFFAHKQEELRPLYASTGSAVPSPRSFSTNSSLDFLSLSPLALTSSPPLTPSGVSSPMAGSMWANQTNFTPPTLQLPGSRLKTTVRARDMDLEAELLELEGHRRQQQQFWNELTTLSSPSGCYNGSPVDWNGEAHRSSGLKPTNLDNIIGSLEPTIFSQLHTLSLDAGTTQLQSPTRSPMRQSMNNHLHSGFPTNLSSSPSRTLQSFSVNQGGGAAAPFLNSRSSAFANRSQSFIDRGSVNHYSGMSSPSSVGIMPSTMSDWGAPDGKLDWGIQKDELSKLRKSASFGLRSSGTSLGAPAATNFANGHDFSRVDSMVTDATSENHRHFNVEEQQQYHLNNNGGSEMLPEWVEQYYMEQDRLVA